MQVQAKPAVKEEIYLQDNMKPYFPPPSEIATDEEIVCIVKKSFPEVSLSTAAREEQRLAKKKYVTYKQCFKAHPFKTSLVVMSVAPLEILKRTTKYTMIGGICGGAVDLALRNPSLIFLFAGLKIGCVAGLVAGILYSKKKVDIEIDMSSEFKAYKESITLEKYTLFLNLVKKYAEEFGKSQEAHHFVDPITEELIEIPVRCPHGQVYNRETLENYITNQNAIEKRMRESFPNFSDEEIADRARMTDPYGRARFEMKDVIFDVEFCKRATLFYKYILQDLSLRPGEDPEIIRGVQAILSSLTKNNKCIRKQTIDTIRQNMFYHGASIDQVNELIRELKAKNIVVM